MKKQLLLLVMMLLPLVASADSVEIDGIYYNLITKGKVAEVTRNPNNYSGDVIIPDKITFEGTEYLVTNIGLAAFEWSSELTSISIPNSVTSIGNEAFWGCRSLTTIKIPNSVISIGQYVFCECYGLTSVDLPNSITSVTEGAFMNCTSLTSIVIPSSVTSIGYKTFAGCQSLASIIMGNSVTSIGQYAFLSCTGLTSITIPNSVKSIDAWAFWNCTGLTSVTFPNSVTTISNFAFWECTGLTSITLGSGISFIGLKAFASCPELTDVYCYANNAPSTNSEAFSDSYIEYTTLHVPKLSIDSYSTIEPWKNFKEIVKLNLPKHNLIYILDGETYITYEIEEGETITPEPTLTKEGYTFSGWSDIPETMPAHDVTVTGSFTINKYKLTYLVDGTEYKTYEVEYGAIITSEPAPTKDGYTFSGWSSIPATMPAKDVTVTGTFTINKYKLTYKVDGEEYKSYQIEYGAKITPEAEPTKEGYSFSGWSSIPETMPANDVVVTGTFTKGTYKLTYMVDGEVYETVSYDFGATITPEAAPTKEGYTFSGWSEIPKTMPAKDVTVTGTFTINKYKLTYMVDGAEYKSYDIEYGATITPEAAPTKEGYTFSGWSEIPQTMPAKNVTVTGTFTINKYKLTYMVDGAEYKSYEIEYGAKITPETEPIKEGYSFSGWSSIPATMPAHDVEITGTFTQVEFVIDDVTYEISGEGTVTIKGSDQKGEVTIEATVEINGHTYRVTAIADNAFKENQSITSVTIPDGINTIGDNAFNGCIGLIVINIGKNVQTIGNKAFANVGTASAARTRSEESMLIVNCYAESVPQTAPDAFENTPIENGSLMVEDNSVNAYKATSPWSRFGRILGFDEAAGINTISVNSENARIYDMQGNRLDNPQKGVNIIRMKDGKTKKMMVK